MDQHRYANGGPTYVCQWWANIGIPMVALNRCAAGGPTTIRRLTVHYLVLADHCSIPSESHYCSAVQIPPVDRRNFAIRVIQLYPKVSYQKSFFSLIIF